VVAVPGRKGGQSFGRESAPGLGGVNVLNHSKTDRTRELPDHTHHPQKKSVTAFERHAASGIEPLPNARTTTRTPNVRTPSAGRATATAVTATATTAQVGQTQASWATGTTQDGLGTSGGTPGLGRWSRHRGVQAAAGSCPVGREMSGRRSRASTKSCGWRRYFSRTSGQ
jgi:hypothetical protein